MTDWRVMVGQPGVRRFNGSGFALSGDVAVTANHVIRGWSADEVSIERDGDCALVRRTERDERLDVAVLYLDRPLASYVLVAAVVPGAAWVVTSGPRGNDPQLSGSVTAIDRRILNDRGHLIPALQLEVAESLEDFGGYSGSAVRLKSRPNIVVGMLCEQVHTRLNSPGTVKPRATNVLYAIPLTLIVRRFGLAVASVKAVQDGALRRVARLVDAADLTAADRELSRMPVSTHRFPAFWYWRAQVALARQNLDVASAYLDEALRRDPQDPHTTAAKIRLLLLRNNATDRAAAQKLAALSYSISGPLDLWLKCLTMEGMFAPGIRVGTELDARCPLPDHEWLEDDNVGDA